MKNFFLALVTLLLIALLGTAIYIYNNPKVIEKITSQDKKDKIKSIEEEKDTSIQDENTDTYPEQTEEDRNELSNTQQQTEERDSEGLTQEDRDRIASKQATQQSPKPPNGLTDDEYAKWEKQTYPPQEHNTAGENNYKYAKEHGLIPEEDK